MQLPRLTHMEGIHALRATVDQGIQEGHGLLLNLKPLVEGTSAAVPPSIARGARELEEVLLHVGNTLEARAPGSAIGTVSARHRLASARPEAQQVRFGLRDETLSHTDRLRMFELQESVDGAVDSLRLRSHQLGREIAQVRRNQAVAGLMGIGAAAGAVTWAAGRLTADHGGGDYYYPSSPYGYESGYTSPADDDF